jgi:hypothetical protein
MQGCDVLLRDSGDGCTFVVPILLFPDTDEFQGTLVNLELTKCTAKAA